MSCKWKDICPLRDLEKRGKIGNFWKENYCNTKDNWLNCKRYQLEFKNKKHSDNLMPDGSYL
ncbi:MAG TPA: uracil-DNA glycosylase [Patescibacteria group bacterium]|nr:uracil-DNA glycosylase [Patescibacteria group bacterium]